MFTILNQLDKNKIMESLIYIIEENFEDFPQIHHKCLEAMDSLQASLDEATIQKEKDAICQQISSVALFSAVLGIQANYQYFANSVSGYFLNTDPEVYLRENIAHSLPDYTAAQQARNCFYDSLTPPQRKIYHSITEYVCYLETVVPKLAHYWGYLLGNELFPRIVPGYQPNMAFTIQYCIRFESFFGQKLNLNKILKSSFSLC